MALPKLFQRIFWQNNTTPAINEDNLNAMSKAIDDIDNRVIDLGTDILENVPIIIEKYDDIEALSENPPYIGTNGNWYVWSTITGDYVDSGIDASITLTIQDVVMLAYGSTPYVTNTGTNTDPVFHLYIPRAAGISNVAKTSTTGLVDTYTITFEDGTTKTFNVTNGEDGVSPGITITTITGGHRVTITDATHPQGQSFDVMDGQGGGSGDMTKAVYDSDGDVENEGGIKAFVQSLGYITGLAWSALTGKPFNTIGSGLTVASNVLKADVWAVSVGTGSSPTATTPKSQSISVNGSSIDIDGTVCFESSSGTVNNGVKTFTFTNWRIVPSVVVSEIDCNVFGVNPIDCIVSSGSMQVKFNASDNVSSCRVYLRDVPISY